MTEPYMLNEWKDADGKARPIHAPYGELIIRALESGDLDDLRPVAIALHPGLFGLSVGSLPHDGAGAAITHGCFSLPTNRGLIRVVMSEVVPPKTGMAFGLKGSRPLAMRDW